MKKIIALITSLLLVFAGISAFAEDNMLDRITAKGEIVIATEGSWAPWTY